MIEQTRQQVLEQAAHRLDTARATYALIDVTKGNSEEESK